MSKKGFAPIVIVLIIALLAAGGITGYTFIKNKQHEKVTTTTTSILITTTTIPILQQTCDSICKAKGYKEGFCSSGGCPIGDSGMTMNIGSAPDCKDNVKIPAGSSASTGNCCCHSDEVKMSCIPVKGTNYSKCTGDPHGTFTSLEECQKVCLSSCVDTDGGNNPYVKGTVTYDGGIDSGGIYTATDKCITTNTLLEGYCSYSPMSISITCPFGYTCKDGACIVSQ